MGTRYKSEDEVTVEEASEIISAVPPLVTPVLVTHLTEREEITKYVEKLQVTTVQLQDDVSPNEILALKERHPHLKIIKTVHVTGDDSLKKAKEYEKVADTIELDSIDVEGGRVGGTGIVHDWKISRSISSELRVPVILAGGLTPENVELAVRTVKPYGVDVNSGVKVSRTDRKKDPKKLREFILRAKRAFLELGAHEFAEGELEKSF